MLEKLNQKFNKRYGQLIANMNINLVQVAKDKDNFEVAVPVLGEGGGTLSYGTEKSAPAAPAKVRLERKRVLVQDVSYRILVPETEAVLAADRDDYFNYLFDRVMDQAIGAYNKTFGGPQQLRFGEMYCEAKELKLGTDGVEIELVGCWASDKQVTEEKTDEQGN